MSSASMFGLMMLICAAMQLVSSYDALNYTVDMRILVDKKAWKHFQDISEKTTEEELKKEITALFWDVQEIYTSLNRNRLYFSFRVKEITILPDTLILSNDGIQIGEIAVLEVERWVLKNQLKSSEKPGITLLYTGEDIGRYIVGWGNINQVCTNRSIAITEYTGTWQDVFVTAHEIGHVLGLRHDGNRDDVVAARCSAEDKYVMAPAIPVNSKNRFKFSHCSYERLYRNSFDRKCLLNNDNEGVVKGPGLGSFVSADEFCSRRFGEGSHVDRQAIWEYNKDICTILRCTKDDGYGEIMSPQGITCAPGKECVRGECTATDTAMKSDSCMFGDVPSIDYMGYKTCAEVPKWECSAMKYKCCDTCNLAKLNRPDEECRKLKGVDSVFARAWYNYDSGRTYDGFVCKELYCTRPDQKNRDLINLSDKFTSKDGFDSEGMICGQSKVCKKGVCVKDMEKGFAYNFESCPFGNQPYTYASGFETCEKLAASGRAECSNNYYWALLCCDSCPPR